MSGKNSQKVRALHLRELLAACPADLAARCELADLLEQLGETDEALAHWREALHRDPNNLQAWEGAARCRRGAGVLDESGPVRKDASEDVSPHVHESSEWTW